jgi:NADPH:quinone reductase
MRKIVCREFGPPSALALEDAAVAAPGPGDVALDIRAAGVNYVDALLATGRYQIKPPLPFTPGSDIAGTVAVVGDGVHDWAPGDQAMAMVGLGGFAERVVLPASLLFRVPPGLDLRCAATCIQSYATMLFAYTRRTTLERGQTVLVLGAGGGIGLGAIDVAVALGARVIAAASSPAKLAAARAAGAAATIDYEGEDLKVRARALSGGGVDVVVDPVGGRHADPALRALAAGGRFLVIGFAGGSIPALPLNQVLLNNRTVLGVDWGAWSFREPGANRELINEVLAMIAAGRLHPAAPTAHPLADAGRVLTDLLERRVTGKAVLLP